MSNRYPEPVAHTDIEVRRHLLHLRHLHTRMMGKPPTLEAAAELRRLERPKKPTKTITTIRLSPEVLAAFKATGKGWQTRMDDILREIVAQGKIGGTGARGHEH